MSKNTKLVLIGFVAAAGIFFFTYLQYQKVILGLKSYIDNAKHVPNQVMDGYSRLAVVRIRDMPGFAGGMGKRQAEEVAAELNANEIEQYEKLSDNLAYPFIDPSIKVCLAVVHQDNINQITRLRRYAKEYMINYAQYNNDLDDLQENVLPKYQCQSLIEKTYFTKTIQESADKPSVSMTSSDSKASITMVERVVALHEMKSDAEWTEDDMVKVVDVLAKPRTAADKAFLQETDAYYADPDTDCTGSGCMLRQREFAAAKLIRDGKATTATKALGLTEH